MGRRIMKYMGSKRVMLGNGLGDLILREAQQCNRIVDLFCGAASVSWFSAQNTQRPVLAVDLQDYAVILSRSVVQRDHPLNAAELATRWLGAAIQHRNNSPLWPSVMALEKDASDTATLVREARLLCETPSGVGPMWNAYGGHYFSPSQALSIDHMLRHLPDQEPERSVCLAAAVSAASRCAAAPGHTAQPFQPNETAAIYLQSSWNRNPVAVTEAALHDICTRHAHVVGEALTADAMEIAAELEPNDLAIVDPPYSSVQYSRFYHVLETVVRGACGEVSGIGRYPPIEERPQSDFSKKTQSQAALERLVSSLASSGATVILTFPEEECSNGLSGAIVREVVQNWYEIEEKMVTAKFSTLGGNNSRRASRKTSNELIILMKPKQR